mgnify:CR=1 FL=1
MSDKPAKTTKNITASTAGIWSYAWTGTGTAVDVASSSFAVEPLAPIAADAVRRELRVGDARPFDIFEIAQVHRRIQRRQSAA